MKTCRERVYENLKECIDNLEKLFYAYQKGEEEKYSNELGTFPEYGLCFDYVPPGTFKGQGKGYFRYQLSWGGPSEEFRFFPESLDDRFPQIEFWFLDWFDGAHITLEGETYDLLRDIWEFFLETEAVEKAYLY